MKEKIAFFGSGSYVLPIIGRLKENFDLEWVVTTEDEHGKVFSYCRENNIEVSSHGILDQGVINTLEDIGAKIAVLASFGIIVPRKVLDIFPLGIINIHPSLLPKFRGPTPVQSAILSGETTTGVSIMKLDSEVDHGPILGVIDHTISPGDTSESLYKKLFELGANLLVEVLPKYISGQLKPTEQNHTKATFTEHLDRQSGFIDINQEPKPNNQDLNLKVRAYYPWPGVWFKANLNGNEKIIKLLPGERIQVEGKNIMSLKDFANGYSEGKEILQKLGLEIASP